MYTCRLILFFVILAITTRVAICVENLALNKSYTLSPKPNYPYCSGPSDYTELTDGISSSCIWTQNSTVGWMKASPAVEVVIDLEKQCRIDSVKIHTIGGGFSNVNYPKFLAVLVSEDNRSFHLCGLLRGSRPLQNVKPLGQGRISGTLSIEDLNCAARYVKILMKPDTRYLFTDEIEVLGEQSPRQVQRHAEENLATADLLSRIDKNLYLIDSIHSALSQTIKSELPIKFKEQVSREAERLLSLTMGRGNELFKRETIAQVESELNKLRASIYREFYKNRFVCVPVNPMRQLLRKDMCFEKIDREIRIVLWSNEYESAAFNIISCSPDLLPILIAVSPLRKSTGEIIDSGNIITLRRAVYVNGASVGYTGDALVKIGTKTAIEPGELCQVWITVNGRMLSPGQYKGGIAVSAANDGNSAAEQMIELNMNVYPFQFPQKAALNTCTWSYYSPGSAKETSEDLAGHYVNVCVLGSGDIPFPRLTSDAPGIYREPNYVRMDEVLSRNSFCGRYLLFLNFREKEKDWGRFGKWMTPEWKRNFSVWLDGVKRHLQSRGINNNQWALYPFDETLCDELYDFCRFVKDADRSISIFANSFGKGPGEYRRFKNLIDIWSFQDSHIAAHKDWLNEIKSFGKEVWMYECLGPGKGNDPYNYYRLMPWRAFQLGLTGAGFWIYYDDMKQGNESLPWDDTMVSMGYYGVVYSSQSSPVDAQGEHIIPSRRWEAWREGVEDYQYLYEVRQAINKIVETRPALAAKAKEQLSIQLTRVIKSADNPDFVYEARKTLSDLLSEVIDANKP